MYGSNQHRADEGRVIGEFSGVKWGERDICERDCGVVERSEGESKGEVCSVETAMWDFSGQILEVGVWTKLQIFQPGMCTVPGRLPTTEKGEKEKEGETDRERERKRRSKRQQRRGKEKNSVNVCVWRGVVWWGRGLQQSKKKEMSVEVVWAGGCESGNCEGEEAEVWLV